jgi:branched-chain amino acid transport system substrate-binding protein
MDVTFSETGDIDRQSFLVEVIEGKQVVKQVLPKVK